MNNDSQASSAKHPCKSHDRHQLVQIGPAPLYWQSVDELHNGIRPSGEFPGGLPGPASASQPRSETSRRDFLALMGFSLAAAGLAGCRAPVQHAIPLLVGSDQLVPGVSNFYATTCGGCASSCSLLVKQRDGRPIKIEGNSESVLFGNGTCATGQATVLSLYDDARLRGPVWQGKPAKWEDVDQQVTKHLQGAEADKRSIVLLSGTIVSPSTKAIIAGWSKRYPNFRHVVYDPISLSALRAAQKESFGRAIVPHYRFDKARVIVGIDADFLGTWLSPVEFARQYAGTRKAEANRSLHIQFEPGLSVTGSNADVRVPTAPSDLGAVTAALLRRIAQRGWKGSIPEAAGLPLDELRLDAIADELWKHRGESLVVSGSQDLSTQVAVNALNVFLGNIGKTVDIERPSLQRAGDDKAVAELLDEMERGNVRTLLMHGVNPGYDYPESQRFLDTLQKVDLSISFSDRIDETSSHASAICPSHHFLEAWGDAEPVDSYFSLSQPLIAPLFDTRSLQESLLQWNSQDPDYYKYLREYWRNNLFARQNEIQDFDVFWDRYLQDGVLALPHGPEPAAPAEFHSDWKMVAETIVEKHARTLSSRADDNFEPHSLEAHGFDLHFYESVALRDGRHANNPWLLELPDPITKVTWRNYAAIAPKTASKFGLADGDIVSLKTMTEQHVELPVFVQPGQEEHTISIALGYGRKQAGKAGNNVGINVFPLAALANGFRSYAVGNVVVAKTGQHQELASTQGHYTLEGRPIVQETTLEELKQAPESAMHEELASLWEKRLEGEHSWGMAIDMNACTGCSACVIACQAENNVPVVGEDQVKRSRIMHWIRIDRYYSGTEENPVSIHQPMMCQHCANAPCETVCPVLATTTSSEGLNAQIYNRCIGTRYCANNCPYKVRRFNWYNYTDNKEYDYNMASPLGRMVLNPDVVVRSRGVMEKCSLCVQRIQLAKNTALQGRRELVDGDIQTACQQVCPSQAIVFGDRKDPNSRLSALLREQRAYQVLEDLGTRPNLAYMKKLRVTTKI